MREVSRTEFVEDLDRVFEIAPFQRPDEDAWAGAFGPPGFFSDGREVLIQEGADVVQVSRDQEIIWMEARPTIQTR